MIFIALQVGVGFARRLWHKYLNLLYFLSLADNGLKIDD